MILCVFKFTIWMEFCSVARACVCARFVGISNVSKSWCVHNETIVCACVSTIVLSQIKSSLPFQLWIALNASNVDMTWQTRYYECQVTQQLKAYVNVYIIQCSLLSNSRTIHVRETDSVSVCVCVCFKRIS